MEVVTRQDICGSDHAPLCVSIELPTATLTNIETLAKRASMLGHTDYHAKEAFKLKKSIPHKSLNLQQLNSVLQRTPPPDLNNHEDVQDAVNTGCNTIMDAASDCTRFSEDPPDRPTWDARYPRWARILGTQDHKLIWKSINWKGTFDSVGESQPSDTIIKNYFEQLLSRNSDASEDEINLDSAPYIPVLDDPFSLSEVENAIKSLNSNKSYSGICPGILKVLPISWFLFFLTLFNIIFTQSFYPILWCYNKLFVLFKGGDRMSCDNYRGISIMDTLGKIYDTLILNRLLMWHNVDKCQAGTQKVEVAWNKS